MLDEFPTLEVAAALGFAVAAIRAYQIQSGVRQLPELHGQVLGLVGAGDIGKALVVAESADARVYPQVAESLLRTAAERRGPASGEVVAGELDEALESAWEVASEKLQSGRARDLIVVALLGSAMLYAWRTGIAAGAIFYLLSIAGCALIAWGVVTRRRVLVKSREAAVALRDALVRSSDRPSSTALGDPCPTCGAIDEVVMTDPDRLGLSPALGVEELAICRACGSLRGRVRDPLAVPVGPEHGTALVSASPSMAAQLKTDDPEQEG